MGIYGNIKYCLAQLCLILLLLTSATGYSASARGLAPPFSPRLHHIHIPAVHQSGSRAYRHKQHPSKSHWRVTQYQGNKRHVVTVTVHHGRHHKGAAARHIAAERHAYPVNFFMMQAPAFDSTALPSELAEQIQKGFDQGTSDNCPARTLVRAGIVTRHPMHGGIFWRREPVKYIIVHSTETGRPIGATRVIDAWSSGGRRHAGAQYVVDRDGTIYQAVDPDLSTVHVNVFKTLPGINNDNSIGIEMSHAGKQTYPDAQKQAVIRLITYLQDRYNVIDDNIVTHRYAQQGDHTDPVAFDWEGFRCAQRSFHMKAVAMRTAHLSDELAHANTDNGPTPSVYMQPHEMLPCLTNPAKSSSTPSTAIGDDDIGAGSTNATLDRTHAQLVQAAPGKQRQLPRLRGPIEMDPRTATILNSVKTPTGTSSDNIKKN